MAALDQIDPLDALARWRAMYARTLLGCSPGTIVLYDAAGGLDRIRLDADGSPADAYSDSVLLLAGWSRLLRPERIETGFAAQAEAVQASCRWRRVALFPQRAAAPSVRAVETRADQLLLGRVAQIGACWWEPWPDALWRAGRIHPGALAAQRGALVELPAGTVAARYLRRSDS
jgi:hypothetical protein